MTKSATREAADEVSAPIASPSFTGNVGVGVTPEAWSSNNPALQIGSGGVLYSHVSNGTRVSLQGNAYVNSSNADAYITTNEASQHIQEDGTHLFKVAPSGTADAAISWTTGFEVLADGKARAKNGLLFGTDTAAANTLDDYEEGTWTPAILYGSLTITTIESAHYTKIGNVVVLQAYLTLANDGNGTDMQITGLPFANGGTGSNANQYSMGGVSHGGGSNTTEMKYCRTQSNASYITIYKKASVNVPQTDVQGNYFLISITYRTTA